MNFLEIQNAVLSDRFDESRRADVKLWINARYGRLWAAEPWAFKKVAVTYALSQGASSVSLATLGLQRIESVWDTTDTYNYTVTADRPEDFYGFETPSSGRAMGFTVIGDTLVLERPSSSARTLTVVGEAKFEELSADGDVPLLPTEFHYMLVHGAASEGLRNENDPTWTGTEQDWQANITDLKSAYLTAVRTYGDAQPSWP